MIVIFRRRCKLSNWKASQTRYIYIYDIVMYGIKAIFLLEVFRVRIPGTRDAYSVLLS